MRHVSKFLAMAFLLPACGAEIEGDEINAASAAVTATDPGMASSPLAGRATDQLILSLIGSQEYFNRGGGSIPLGARLDLATANAKTSAWKNCVQSAAAGGMGIGDIHKKCDALYDCNVDNGGNCY